MVLNMAVTLLEIMYTPVSPSFTKLKWGSRGSKLHRLINLMSYKDKKKGVYCNMSGKNGSVDRDFFIFIYFFFFCNSNN